MNSALEHPVDRSSDMAVHGQQTSTPFGKWIQYLLAPVDGSSLAFFRISFAVLMIVGLLQLTSFIPDYVQPHFHFSYIPGLPPLTPQGATILFTVMAVCAANIGLGFLYRASSLLFCLATSYILLLDKALYINPLYLTALLSFLLFIVPGNRVFSLDNGSGSSPRTVPRLSVLVFRAQIAIVYFFSGIAKLNSDWINGYPQLFWIMKHKDDLLIHLLGQNVSMVTITYGAIAADLLTGVLLLSRRTFGIGIALIVIMHSINYTSFVLSIHPWLIFATLILFGSPSWPRRFVQRFRGSRQGTNQPLEVTSANVGIAVKRKDLCLIAIAHIYIVCQIITPLRQFLYPPNLSWAELGSRFSWCLIVPGKEIKEFEISAIDERSGAKRKIDAQNMLSAKQYNAMIVRPDLILQLAHALAAQEFQKTGTKPMIKVRAVESLNSRPFQNLINPDIDLASQPDALLSSPPWVVPLRRSR